MAIAIGPVQDFIAASRKTRDLWFGSTLLSRIARGIARDLQGRTADLIFPSIPDDTSIDVDLPFPNKLLAKLESDNPAKLANEIEQAARASLVSLVVGVLETLDTDRQLDFIHQELAEEQARSFLEFYVAWTPYTGEANYANERLRVERLLSARKSIREFARAPDIADFAGRAFDTDQASHQAKSGVAKSSLDPARETVLRAYHPTRKTWRPSSAENPVSDSVRSRLKLKGGEQLDGISLLKRLGETRRFVSTSRIAIDPFIRRLERSDQQTLSALTELARKLSGTSAVEPLDIDAHDDLRVFSSFPYDTQLFFYPKASDEQLPNDKQKLADQFFQTVRVACRELDISELINKVAVLAADGDGMGKAIAARTTTREHKILSDRLADFAIEARAIVARHRGAAIYTGGDDVLAMLPLDTALSCADELRRQFDTIANEELPAGLTRVSLSAGVAVGHYASHLQSLLKWSRDAEQAAKQGGRNALAVSLHTGDSQSGGITFVHPWSVDPVQTHWRLWSRWYLLDLVPRGFGYELRDLARDFAQLVADDSEIGPLLANRSLRSPGSNGAAASSSLLELEVSHLLESKRSGTEREIAKDDINRLLDIVGNSIEGLKSVADELIAALHFAQAMEIAEGRSDHDTAGEEKQ